MGVAAGATAVGGLLGAVGDSKRRRQAKKNLKYQKGQVDRGYDFANQQLDALFGEGGEFDTLFGQARDDIQSGYGAAGDFLSQGFDKAGGTLQQGFQGAIDRLDPFATGGQQAFDLYNQALQGGEGASAAFDAFQQSTGYNFLQDEAARATQRQFAARGQTGSGNVLAALQERSQGLAQQSYTDFLGQLMGSAQLGLQATGAQSQLQSGLASGLAGLQSGEAQLQAGLQTTMADQLAAIMGQRAGLTGQIRGGALQGGLGLAGTALGNTQQAGQFMANAAAAPWHTLGATVAGAGNQGAGGFADILKFFQPGMGG